MWRSHGTYNPTPPNLSGGEFAVTRALGMRARDSATTPLAELAACLALPPWTTRASYCWSCRGERARAEGAIRAVLRVAFKTFQLALQGHRKENRHVERPRILTHTYHCHRELHAWHFHSQPQNPLAHKFTHASALAERFCRAAWLMRSA